MPCFAGARANAVFTSLLASCRMLVVEPWSYLRDILCLIPRWPIHPSTACSTSLR